MTTFCSLTHWLSAAALVSSQLLGALVPGALQVGGPQSHRTLLPVPVLMSLTLEAASFACSVFSLAIFVNCCAATQDKSDSIGRYLHQPAFRDRLSYVHLQQHINAAYINGILLRARQARHYSLQTALYRA